MKKIMVLLGAMTAGVMVMPVAAFAHVVVTPTQATIGERTAFSVSVPNERDDSVTSIKLAIPKGVSEVMPTVIGGWEITTEKDRDDVTSITWTGVIPTGQRADLGFKAQTPAGAGEITWKAYQTYADGTVVRWDQAPVEHADEEESTAGPYSVTRVQDDLAEEDTGAVATDTDNATLALVISGIALVFSILSLLWRRRKE